MNKNSKLHTNINIRNLFFCEVGFGILANTILLLFYILMFVRKHRPKPTDLFTGLLALFQLVSLVIVGVIGTDIFMSWRGWNDIACKLLIYLYRFLRGLFLGVTCLLSVLQAVTLSPRSSCLAKLKPLSPQQNVCSLLILCAFNMSVSSHLFISVFATPNLTSDNLMYITESCSMLPLNYSIQSTFSILLASRETFFIGLMVVSSVYMVTLLHRHKKQSKHLHSTSLSPKASPERRATCTILLLTSFFVVMSALDGIIFYLRTMMSDDPIFYCIQILVSHGYATLSPWVFISTDKRITNFLRSIGGKTISI